VSQKGPMPKMIIYLLLFDLQSYMQLFLLNSFEKFLEDFLEIDQSKTGIACGSHVCKWIKTK
jgi:hypothetical protein